jgi:hypothetical protein
MKKLLLSIAVLGLFVGSLLGQPTVNLIPNGDFEDVDDSLTWIRVDGSGDGPPVTFDVGGNTGGYGQITPSGGWGILVSPIEAGATGGGVPIVDLGISAGSLVTFTLDMKNDSGDGGTVGGMKVEAWGGNALLDNTGDVRPALIGDGSTWETYTFDWTLPTTTEKLIFVPLWDLAGEPLGIDNVGVVVPEPSTFALLGGLFAIGFVLWRRRR